MVEFLNAYVPLALTMTFVVVLNATVLMIFLSSLDDFLVDCLYYARRLYRGLVIRTRYARASAKTLQHMAVSLRPFAICIPAWQEADVIQQMLLRTVKTLDYAHYRIFVGVYDNDAATRDAIKDLLSEHLNCADRIEIVKVGHGGPTNKADCLNCIYQHIAGASAWAEESPPVGIVLHDAEDVVHAQELHVFNHLIGRADIIQLPVVPLKRPLLNLVGGHYQDEFSESHAKDLVVREMLGCGLPSAGVGCMFSADALVSLAMLQDGRPFDARSVTEDYDIALNLCAMGYRAMFVRLPSNLTGGAFVATQEYFPDSFRASVRQKSRWLLGIALESWSHAGWSGSWRNRYMLLRDRKAILTSLISIVAYVLAAILLILPLLRPAWPSLPSPGELLPDGGVIHTLIWLNVALLVNRVIQRFAFVYRIYGLAQALVSPLRIVVGNVINFCAALQAVAQFRSANASGEPLKWAKTDHHIPDIGTLLPEPGTR